MILLNEARVGARGVAKVVFVEALKNKPSGVSVNMRREEYEARDGQGLTLHYACSLITSSK